MIHNKEKCRNIGNLLVEVCLFTLFYCIYYYCCVNCASDMQPHSWIAIRYLQEGTLFKNNFILYLLVNVFSAFTGKINYVYFAISGLLAFATTWRCRIVTNTFTKMNIRPIGSWLCGISLAFVFITPVFKNYAWYHGYYVPNVWHNSTIIFVFPFAILLYQHMLDAIKDGVLKRNVIWMTILVILNIYIKPSFFFVFVCVYPLVMLYRYQFTKEFWVGMIPIVIGLLCLGLEFVDIYGGNTVTDSGDESWVYLDFKTIFSYEFWQNKLPVFVISFAFLGLFVLCFMKSILRDVEFWTLAIMMFVAIAIYLFCKEGGPRANDGNFYWQVVPTMWLCYYYALRKIIIGISTTKGGGQRILSIFALILFSAQVLSGLAYLVKYLVTGDYF